MKDLIEEKSGNKQDEKKVKISCIGSNVFLFWFPILLVKTIESSILLVERVRSSILLISVLSTKRIGSSILFSAVISSKRIGS